MGNTGTQDQAGSSSGGTGASSAFKMPYLHRAIASVQSGTAGDKKVLLIGDSTTYGYNGINGIGPALSLAQRLAASSVPSQVGLAIPNVPPLPTLDLRFVVGAGWVQTAGAFVWGGASAYYSAPVGAAGLLSYTPGNGGNYDRFDVYYMTAPSFGTVQANVDGGANTPIVTAAANAIAKTTIVAAAPATNHVLNLGTVTVGATGVLIVGIEPWLSTKPSLRIGNCGVNGTTAASWINETDAPWGPLDCIGVYAPDVSIISLGINDAIATISPASYIASLTTLAAAARVSGDVIIASQNPVQSAPVCALLAQYNALLQGLCSAHGYTYLDNFDRWGAAAGYALLNPLGYYTDIVHPSQAIGYPDLGISSYNALMNA